MINVAELDERIERCLAILADNPQSQVFAALAEAYRRRGEFGRAFAVCKSGIKHHPDYAPAHIVMAKLYLHQKMLPDAVRALERAVELEGQTRITDLLEAELYVEMNELGHAQAVIERLRISDPSNPVVDELSGRIRLLKRPVRAQVAAQDERPSDSEQAATPGSPKEDEPRAKTEPPTPSVVTWDEWSGEVCKTPALVGAFAFDPAGRQMTVCSKSPFDGESFQGVLSMLWTIDAALRESGFGPLEEVRIETDSKDLWSARVTGYVIGLIGKHPFSYGSARRMALELVEDIESLDETSRSGSSRAGRRSEMNLEHDNDKAGAGRRNTSRERG